ncbi:hypothetical protein C8J56DRAFT_802327, partial [Mycena floridula]
AILDRLITAKDHASVQINIADVDTDHGRAIKSTSKTLPLAGQIRAKVDSKSPKPVLKSSKTW